MGQGPIHIYEGRVELDETDDPGGGGKRPQWKVHDEFTAAVDAPDIRREIVSAEDPPDSVIPDGCRIQVLRQNLA